MSQFDYAADPPESSLNADITSTATSMEVDFSTAPNGLSAGDRVKCIIEQDHPHELVYGTIGTLGGGANGGTDITSLTRGAEDTDPASHTAGDVVIVGAGGRDEIYEAHAPPFLEQEWLTLGDAGTHSPSQGSAYLTLLPLPYRVTITDIAIEVASASSTDGSTDVGIYDQDEAGVPTNLLWNNATFDTSTTGLKQLNSLSITLVPGRYWFAFLQNGYTTAASIRLGPKSDAGAFLMKARQLSDTRTGTEPGLFTFGTSYTSLPADISSDISTSNANKIPYYALKVNRV